MANKVHFNIKNVHYAVLDSTSEYGTPVAIPGAVSLSVDPTGDESTFYADGIEYYKSYGSTGYEGSLNIAILPDAFRKDVLGEVEDTKHVLVEKTNPTITKFALGFQIDGDDKSTYFWFYNCTASRPSVEANTTEEDRTPDTETLDWSCTAGANGFVRAKTTDTTATTDITSWFTAVYAPTVSAG